MTDHDARRDDLDRLLTDAGADEAALSRMLHRTREVLVEGPDEVTAARHLSAIAATAREHAHAAPSTPPVRTFRRRLTHVLGLTATKVALGVGVAAAATGGLAAAGSLPDAVQRTIADGAARIGVDLPHPDDAPEDIGSPVEELPDPETGAPTQTPATARSESTRGATVDAPTADGGTAPVTGTPAETVAPVDDPPPNSVPPTDPASVEPPAGSGGTGAASEPSTPPVTPSPPPGSGPTSPPSGGGDETPPTS